MTNKCLYFFMALFFCTSTYYVVKGDLYKVRRLRVEPSFAGVDPFYLPVQKDLQQALLPLQGQVVWRTGLSKLRQIVQADSRVKSFNVQRRLPGHYVVQMVPHRPVAVWLSKEGVLHPVSSQDQILRPTPLHELPDVPVLRGAVFKKSLAARQKAVAFLAELPREGWLSMPRVLELQYDAKKGLSLLLRWPSGTLAAASQSQLHDQGKPRDQNQTQGQKHAQGQNQQQGQGLDRHLLHQAREKPPRAQKIKLGHQHYRQKIKRLEKVLAYLHSAGLKNQFIDARFEKKVLVRLHKTPEAKGTYALRQ